MATTKAREPKVPQGYEDEDSFIKEARERFQEAVDFDKDNRDAGLEDARFAAGEQWDDTAKLARAGRPTLVINRLPQFIAQVVGDIRINRPSIKVRPAEDADKDLAGIREGMIRAIERDCDAQGVYATAGQSQVTCGIGNFRAAVKYAGEMAFDRDLTLDRIADPFAVVWDPLSIEPTGRDARYCFVADEVPRKDFEEAYPDEMPSSLEAPSGEREGWFTKDTVRVTEYWRVIEKPMDIALLSDGSVVPMDKVPADAQVIQTRKSSRKYACMYLITGSCILDGPYEWPIDRVPIFRVQGWEFNVGTKRVRFGLVRWAKDPQRLLNYWRSVAAETLAMAPKGKWLVHETAVDEDSEDDFRQAHNSSDPMLRWKGGIRPEYTQPPAMPAALLQEAALNSQDMKDVTGLQDASLGVRSNETSGKAIMARQREGDVATYIYHDNLRAAIAEAGKVLNAMIPVCYDTPRTIRIVGEDDATKVQRVNDPNNPNSVDINQGRYDVSVETGPSYSTKRAEAADSLIQFMQAVPAAAAVASDLVAKAMDWPMADILAERLKKTIPPQILEGEDGQEPKQPNPAEMQAMEMQQQAAQAEVQEKIANADKAKADAAHAMFDAQKAELELAAMQYHAEQGDHTFGKMAEMERQMAMRMPQMAEPMPQAAPAGVPTPDQFDQALQQTRADPAALQDLSGQGLPTPEEPAMEMPGI